MRLTACYFPVVPNRPGELKAVSFLSPRARARTRPVFEIDRPPESDASDLESHIAESTRQVTQAWGTRHPLLVDLPAYGLDHQTTRGVSAIEHAFLCLRQLGMKVVPVVGPASARGVEVLRAMGKVAHENHCGAALCIPFFELSHPNVLERELQIAKQELSLPSEELDLLLDLEAVLDLPEPQRSTAHLAATVREAVATLGAIGHFRNLVLCGSSVPESVGKSYNATPYRGRRIELDVWRAVLGQSTSTISFSDHGITAPRGQDPRGFGPAPARIRLSTRDTHVFYRAEPKEYIDLCRRVVSDSEYDSTIESWGASQLRGCADGYIKASSATTWVARDTNLHIEGTLAEVERHLGAIGQLENYSFPPTEKMAWLQRSILETS